MKLYINEKKKPCPSFTQYNFNLKWSAKIALFPLSCSNTDKKEEIWLSHMTKAPTPTEMSKEQSENTNNATKKFD